MFDFPKEMHFDVKAQIDKSTRDRTLIKLLKSPILVVSASGVSKQLILSYDPDELCTRLQMLLQEKQAGNDSDSIIQENNAIVDKLLGYKCLFKKQLKQFLNKFNISYMNR